jgi:NAD(P)-dependent dehydrogenase (short-subunit alcohol dehydrogenase family)
MMKKLEGKIAVITGGTEGIGLAAAKLFVQEGAYVFITGRRQKELDDAVRAIGSNVSGVQGDVAKLADLERLYETVSKVKGRIDIVFANAGVGEFVPFGAVTEEHFDKLFNINVRGTLFTVQKALPLLKDGGSIILNGSVASVKGTAAFGVYAASKAGIRSFVRTWTTDLQERRIRSNVVSPGPINTPLVSRQSADVIARIVSTIPMGRMGEPEEVAKVALFLASDDSSFVTGIELPEQPSAQDNFFRCSRALVKQPAIVSSLHLAFIKRSHSARSMQLKSPCSLSNERFFCSQS